jgi:hypothetical protein
MFTKRLSKSFQLPKGDEPEIMYQAPSNFRMNTLDRILNLIPILMQTKYPTCNVHRDAQSTQQANMLNYLF